MTQSLGPYELRGKLGTGAMAVVWRAWDPKLEREVAIKEPVRSPGTAAAFASELAARFVQEGKTAARLSHPGIVTIFAAEVFDSRPAIVMELLRGTTLATLLDRHMLSGPMALSVLDQLLDALEYAHAMGVVHRDVKPDNVFVLDDGRVKLTDFGVAHVGRIDGQPDSLIAGTPGYMAPEQIVAAPVDGRADLFGIGAIAYEMIAGHNPFGATEGLDSASIMFRTTHGGPVAFDPSLNLAPPLAATILRALEKEPAGRFRCALEMRMALRDAAGATGLAGIPVASGTGAPPPSPAGGVVKGVTLDTLGQKAKGGSAATTTVIALAITLGGVGLIAALSSPDMVAIGTLMLLAGVGGAVWWLTNRHGKSPEAAVSPDLDLFGRAVPGAPGGTAVLRLRGPRESRDVRVALPCEIGRSSEVSLCVDDDLVSRRHARIESREGRLWVSDLERRNGTFVDGVPAGTGTELSQGAVASIGSTTVQVVEEG